MEDATMLDPTTRFMPDPAKVPPVNDLLTRWMGGEGPVSSVYAAYLLRTGQFPSLCPPTRAKISAGSRKPDGQARAEIRHRGAGSAHEGHVRLGPGQSGAGCDDGADLRTAGDGIQI